MVSGNARIGVAVFVASFAISSTASAERFGGVEFPRGESSFADRVVSVSRDNPLGFGLMSDGSEILGPPDDRPFLLGNVEEEGQINEIIVEFVDNALIDVEGADLHVFETDTAAEPIDVAISVDGVTWYEVGQIDGVATDIDLADTEGLPENELFYFVRVRDVVDGRTSVDGPDLDAVGAIGTIDSSGLASDVCANTQSAQSFAGIEFAHGPLSFADDAVLYRPAIGVEGEARDPAKSIGGPDGESTSLGAATTVQPGELTVFFRDNVLVDLIGPDVVIIGTELEGLRVEISTDGEAWVPVGVVDANGQVDISSAANPAPKAYYRFLRLTGSDDAESADGPSAGADIDAIGALSSCDPVVVNDTDGDGVPDELTTEPIDFDNDGFIDTEDTCPADPTVAQSTPLAENQRCNWPGVQAGPGFIIEDEEGCSSTGGSPAAPWAALLLFGMWLGRRAVRNTQE